jgi:hypothetical protein
MGRPSKFTPDRCERFLAALSTGVFPETAARHAGWSPATLYRILAASSPAHVAFRDEVRRVETELELRLAGTVTQAAFRDPRLALALLERRFGERWGRRAALLAPAAAEGQGGVCTAKPVVIIEPALIEAMVPALLEARLGSAGSAEAIERIERFVRPAGGRLDDR